MHRITPVAAILAALAAWLAFAAPALARYGAFAHDDSTGRYGFAWNEETQQQADERALRDCGGKDKCKVEFRFGAGQCAAFATPKSGNVWGGAWRDTEDGAKLAAVEDCQKHTSGQCTPRGGGCNQ
jgi:hypothetical protein